MDNKWANPEGIEADDKPLAVHYRIRNKDGDVVDRYTDRVRDRAVRDGRWYHSLAPGDQHFADKITNLIQAACTYFWVPIEHYVGLEGVPDVQVTDDEVRTRIDRLNRGENQREAERVAAYGNTGIQSYPLDQLPWDQQRALVEQIDALKREWQFEILGEAAEGEEEAARKSVTTKMPLLTDEDIAEALGYAPGGSGEIL